jgi:hypothetical protein
LRTIAEPAVAPDRAAILDLRDTTPLQAARQVNGVVRRRRCGRRSRISEIIRKGSTMSRFLQKQFARKLKFARTLIIGVVFCFCLPSGALSSHPYDPLPKVPLRPIELKTNPATKELKRLDEEQKARAAWISWIWIVMPGGILVVLVLARILKR